MPSAGVPVRVSLGVPGWFPEPLVDWMTVAPWGLLTRPRLEPEEFRRRYRHRLHVRGRRVLAELEEMRSAYDAPLVLLCWEAPGSWCHRVVLGEWLGEHGVPVEEVVPPTMSVADELR
jgi:hypothetical protein